jgi:hypothetical protein
MLKIIRYMLPVIIVGALAGANADDMYYMKAPSSMGIEVQNKLSVPIAVTVQLDLMNFSNIKNATIKKTFTVPAKGSVAKLAKLDSKFADSMVIWKEASAADWTLSGIVIGGKHYQSPSIKRCSVGAEDWLSVQKGKGIQVARLVLDGPLSDEPIAKEGWFAKQARALTNWAYKHPQFSINYPTGSCTFHNNLIQE